MTNCETNGGTSYTTYFYGVNAQGDVEKIFRMVLNSDTGLYEEKIYGLYTYDAWGSVTATTAAGNAPATTTLVYRNPIRYRGYVYDNETGFYYLQSRYYDPANHRFINADSLASTGQGFIGCNMFVYCGNNPACHADLTGTDAGAIVVATAGTVATVIGAAIEAAILAVAVCLTVYVGVETLEMVKDAIDDYPEEANEYTIAIELAIESEAVYWGAKIDKHGRLQYTTLPMTFEEAYIWATACERPLEYASGDIWGLYTSRESDAMAMAYALGGYATPVKEEHFKNRHYEHYHTKGHVFLHYFTHFHVWYGSPV